MAKHSFKLYIVDDNETVKETVEYLKSIFDMALKENYKLEVIDILKNPELAVENKIIASPTLVMELPEPPKRYIGKIKDKEKLLLGLKILSDNKLQ